MKYKVVIEVKTYATSTFVQLEGYKVSLAYNGNDLWKATKVIDVTDGVLDVVFQCNGLNGTDWGIALMLNNDKKPILEKNGTIMKKNYSLIIESIPLPGYK